jgi:hypothetical protein
MDGVIVEGRRGGSHMETPWIGAKAQSKIGEKSAAIEVVWESDEEDET